MSTGSSRIFGLFWATLCIRGKNLRPNAMLRFVTQEHSARTHHFDFSLEKYGVFKNWAVLQGLSEEPGINRLAVQAEDHNPSLDEFEGTIPEGHYGAV